MVDDEKAQTPIGEVLSRVSHELAHLAGRLDHLESLVGPLIREAECRDPDMLRHVQGLDYIRQKLGGLADFLAALAPEASAAWLTDPSAAARVVTLADLASRLGFADANEACLPSGRDTEEPGATWGDCELF